MKEKLQASLYNSRKRQRNLQKEGRFASFIETPHNLGTQPALNPATTPFVMPASGWIGLSLSVVSISGDINIGVGTRTILTKDLAANQIFRVGFFEKGFKITPTVNIPGTLTLYLFNQWFKNTPIATGIWS